MAPVGLIFALFMSTVAPAATIERIRENGNLIVLSLTAAEEAEFKVGEVIKIQTRSGGDPIEGQIKKIDNGKALVKVGKKGALKRGKEVEVAAMGNVYTGPVSRVGVPPADAPSLHDDPVFSDNFVNPAEIHEVDNLRADFKIAQEKIDLGVKMSGFDATLSTTGPDINLAAVKRIAATGTRIGLALGHTEQSARIEADLDANQFGAASVDVNGRITTNRFAPIVAYTFAENMTIAASLTVEQRRLAGELHDDGYDFNFERGTFGALFHPDNVEVGVAVTTKVDAKEENTDEDGNVEEERVQLPLTAIVHGRLRVTPKTSVRGVMEVRHNNAFNTEDRTPQRNNFYFESGIRTATKNAQYFDIALFGETPKHVHDSDIAPDSIPTYGLSAGFHILHRKTSQLGATVRYDTGSDDYKDQEDDLKIKMTRDSLTIALQGAIPL